MSTNSGTHRYKPEKNCVPILVYKKIKIMKALFSSLINSQNSKAEARLGAKLVKWLTILNLQIIQDKQELPRGLISVNHWSIIWMANLFYYYIYPLAIYFISVLVSGRNLVFHNSQIAFHNLVLWGFLAAQIIF